MSSEEKELLAAKTDLVTDNPELVSHETASIIVDEYDNGSITFALNEFNSFTGRYILFILQFAFYLTEETLRFSIAHELAHIFLGHGQKQFVSNCNGSEVIEVEMHENEADELAVCWGFPKVPREEAWKEYVTAKNSLKTKH